MRTILQLLSILLAIVTIFCLLEIWRISLTFDSAPLIRIDKLQRSSANDVIVNIFSISDLKDHDFQEAVLPNHNEKPIRIFVYDRTDAISKQILNGHSWDYHVIVALQNYMKMDKDLQFIDIGAGIGVYALYVARLGRKVVATDAIQGNLLRLAQSAKANSLTDRITLVNNVIEADRVTLYLRLKTGSPPTRVQAISAEHLLKIVPFKRAVLKVNIQGHIPLGIIFSKCTKLFEKVDIPLVIFKKETHDVDIKALHDFMIQRGYIAFPAIDSESPLRSHHKNWPHDIIWKRQTKANPVKISDLTRVPNTHIIKYTNSFVSEIFNKYSLRTQVGPLIIYGHDASDRITRAVMTGQWEPEMMATMTKVLKADKTQGFIDIGSNIGIYTLLAAKLGINVVAVDANIENVLRLKRAAVQNGLNDKIELINNAIYNKYTRVGMVVPQEHVGLGTVVDDTDKRYKYRNVHGVETITLDDLLKVTTFKKAIMKIDIEGKEYHAFCNSSKLLKEIDVTHVFMEWGYYTAYKEKKHEGEFMQKHFGELGYVPLKNVHAKEILPSNFSKWPWDVVWVKKYIFDEAVKPNKTALSH